MFHIQCQQVHQHRDSFDEINSLLNQQYDSVFTDENMLEVPELGDSSIPDIGKLTVTENGVNKLLKNLNITKAIGQDMIPSRVLKEAADQITPFLTRIFDQILESGEVPSDLEASKHHSHLQKGIMHPGSQLQTSVAHVSMLQDDGTYHLPSHNVSIR